ncbi:GIY-YIG nuclease family protein [Haloarcula sp. S1AR25-5A]|uniref:GIY-YIG nuclease family protein n=1 Tax=Haloarcula terrestris TaxID=2950533 RepID=A0AAE4F0C9_9EURY|nr:GIY-YIG nuclease family protein [Haloarcula terrestris]MDS0223470.1 GIY-YIG nuclease family protein [Haloarcula terrestris]
MADFRTDINRLQDNNTKSGLKDKLAQRLGERTTSVNPLTTAMFEELQPGTRPVEYARQSEYYTPDTSRVATNAIALKILLHEQVGRPLYEPVERLVKQDFAECIVAIDAFRDGMESGRGLHTPTTLPENVSGFVDEPPDRADTIASPFGVIADLDTSQTALELDVPEASHYVYVLDCTPPLNDEPGQIWDRRRAVKTKIEAGIPLSRLEPKERATDALNQQERVYYVGSTSDPTKRIQEHMSGTDKSGVNFTNSLPPQAVVEVTGCNSRQAAESNEGARAREIHRKDGLFAYSDEM